MLKKNFVKKAISAFTVAALISTVSTFALAGDSYGKLKAADPKTIGQKSEPEKVIVRDGKGKKIIYRSGKLTKESKKSVEDITKDYVKENEGILKTKNNLNNFNTKAKHENVYDKTVMELEQTYKDIPVYGTTKYVHIDKEGAVDLVSGYFLADIEDAKGLKNSICLSDKDALKVIMKDLDVNDPSLLNVKSDLNVYPKEEINDAVYAYKVDITYSEPDLGNWTYFIDASTGEIVKKQNNARAEHANAYGKDSYGNLQSLSVDELFKVFPIEGILYLRNTKASDLYTCNCNGTKNVGKIFTTLSGKTFDDPAAVDAHLYGSQTYDYFKNKFDRKGYDDEGSALKIGVHYYEKNNAVSYGGTIVFGDGDGVNTRSTTAGIDVMAHEYTHEIVRDEILLGGVLEADAINESISDTFSAVVSDYYGKSDAQCWTIADEMTLNGRGIRSMSNPGSFNLPDHMSEFNSSESCYYNVGILNKAAFLISQGGTFNNFYVNGIGYSKLAKIYYRAITNKSLTSNATFNQFYYSIRDAAKDIYGMNSVEYNAVRAAFGAVGIDEQLIIYADENFGGKGTAALGEGDFNLSDLVVKGFVNDWASSVYLPWGYTVQLFDEDGLKSDAKLSEGQWVLTRDDEGAKRFTTLNNNPNDRISSVRVRRGVTFYENINYTGYCTKGILPGKYRLADLARYGFKSGWVSSVVIPEGWYVTMYGGDNFTGDPIRLDQMDHNSKNFVNIGMNDNVSSIEVGIKN